MGSMQMVRVTGKVEQVNDQSLIEKLLEDCPWLHDVFKTFPEGELFIFRIAHGEAQYLDMSLNCREKNTPLVVF
jgi:uncharacterized pyridoxamine 5'-phosphate oxidase family protein